MNSESTSIPTNPRTTRPVGYAFVDLSTATEAQRAISELSGKEILNRKVSVQLARKPEAATEKVDGAAGGEGVSGGEGRRRNAGRGRGRGRGRGGRSVRGGRVSTPPPSSLPKTVFCANMPCQLRMPFKPMAPPRVAFFLLLILPLKLPMLRTFKRVQPPQLPKNQPRSHAHLVSLDSVVRLKMEFRQRIRSWSPIFPTT